MVNSISIRKCARNLIRGSLYNEVVDDLPKDITIDEIIDIGIRGQMDYLFMKSLISLAKSKPELDQIKRSLAGSTYKTFLQWNSINEISNALEQGKVRHQFLKGSILKRMYPSPEMRDMSDIDIVVYDDDLEKAENTFSASYSNSVP